jgi:hypothetical protein
MGSDGKRRKRLAVRISIAALALTLVWAAPFANAGSAKGARPKDGAKARYGVVVSGPKAFRGYTLLAPLHSRNTYLIDMQGRVVHTWKSEYYPELVAYLLENGHLLRAARRSPRDYFGSGQGPGGRIEEFTWDGQLVWDFKLNFPKLHRHHDICKLPNGNVLVIAAESKTGKEAAAVGRKDAEDSFAVDCLLEVRPTGKTTGEVVWEWHIWDHLIQDVDKAKPGYGSVAAHPELVDINFHGGFIEFLLKRKKEWAKLRTLGYVGAPPTGKKRMVDWTHVNSVAYNAELDQIMLSVHEFSEIWVIDHGTTRAEAAGHKGGRHGKGGDLLYRWGNPRTYRAGTASDQQFFFQHDGHWIPRGLPGAGHVLVFNNGGGRGGYSSVDETVLPADKQGRYPLKPGTAYGPDRPYWSYTAPRKTDFFAGGMSGAHRLPNGNTFICSTTTGTLFEVTPEKETVWKYVIAPPSLNLRPVFLASLGLTAGQTRQLEQLQEEVRGKLEALLDRGQKEQLESAMPAGPGLDGLIIGQVMPLRLQYKLKLTGDQRKQVGAVQKEIDAKFHKVFQAEQEKMLRKIRGQILGTGKGGKAGMGGDNKQGIGAAFRAYRYAPSHPALVGRQLTPGGTVEELEANEAKSQRPR